MNFTVIQAIKNITNINIIYGYLYNWYAATDVRNIANTGWHIPTKTEFDTLITYLGGNDDSGDKLREIGTLHWTTIGGTNISGFSALPNGYRQSSGTSLGLHNQASWWTSTLFNPTKPWSCDCVPSYCETQYTFNGLKVGYAIRLIKDSTSLINGQTGTYIGNDGKVYNTICIDTQEWLSENLIETKYRNGNNIPEVTDNIAWSNLVTDARCSYNNNWTNAYFNTYTISPMVFTVFHVLACGLIDDEMKYLDTITLPTGVETDVATTLVAEPYNVFILDSSGNDITSTVTINVALSGGVYHVKIYNGGATLTNVKLKILY